MKAVELRELLDKGNILVFKYNDFKVKVFPDSNKAKGGLDAVTAPEHTIYVNGINQRKIKYTDPLYNKWFKSLENWTKEDHYFKDDLRFIIRGMWPEVDPVDEIGKYFVRTEVLHTEKEKKQVGMLRNEKQLTSNRQMKKEFSKNMKVLADAKRMIRNTHSQFLTKDGKLISIPRMDSNIGRPAFKYLGFYQIEVKQGNSRSFEIIEGYTCEEAYEKACNLFSGEISVQKCIGILHKRQDRLKWLESRNLAKDKIRQINKDRINKKYVKRLQHEEVKRRVCVKEKETGDLMRMDKYDAQKLVDKGYYSFCNKTEWKTWRREQLKSRGKIRHQDSPYGGLFPPSYNRTGGCQFTRMFNTRHSRTKYKIRERDLKLQLVPIKTIVIKGKHMNIKAKRQLVFKTKAIWSLQK